MAEGSQAAGKEKIQRRRWIVGGMDGIKVLMVDDEARMRKLVKDFLSIKGYKVIEAEDGEQAGRSVL